MSNLIVYNYLNYKHEDKAAEFKRKRKLCDKVHDYAKKAKHDYYPIGDFTGFLMHVHLSNKFNEKFIIVAESKDILPDLKGEEYKFVSTEDYLNGKY